MMRGSRTKDRVFADTNILLDVLLEREGFCHDALKIWAASELGKVDGYVSAISINNVYFIMRKLKSDTTAMIAVRMVMRVFKVVPLDVSVLELAAELHFKDYEDDIQLQSAIKAGCTKFFTRDLGHYETSALDVTHPSANDFNSDKSS